MKETTEIKETVEAVENVEIMDQETVKPYNFRKLSSKDIFLMTKILGKIGIRQFKGCFEGEALDALIKTFKEKKSDDALMSVGVAVGFEGIDIILGNLHKCENDIYQMLSNVSGVSVAEIEEDAILFTEMLIDFFKKAEFPAFIKVVSKLFK